MATLIVETGAGLPNANTYASLEFAAEYHARTADWAGSADDLTDALLIAWDSLHLLYGPDLKGMIQPTSTQAGLFPRFTFVDNNGRLVPTGTIPSCVIEAQCEIALMYLQDVDVFPQRATAQNVLSKSVKVGELATTTQYAKAVEGESFPGFRKVDLKLAPVLNNKKPVAYYRVGL